MRLKYRVEIVKSTIQDEVESLYLGSANTISHYYTEKDTAILELKLYDFGFNHVATVTHQIDFNPILFCNPASLYQYGRVIADRMITKLEALDSVKDLYHSEDQ